MSQEEDKESIVLSGRRRGVVAEDGAVVYVIDESNMSDGSTRTDIHREGLPKIEKKPENQEMTE